MNLPSVHLLSAGAVRASIEAAAITAVLVLAGALAWRYTGLPALYLALPLGAVVAACRLRPRGHALWRRLRRELGAAALTTAGVSGTWLLGASLALPRERLFTSSPLAAVLLAFLPGLTYAATRAGLRAWRFWNQLRRRRLAWALTHAMLVTVALVSLLVTAAIFLQLRQSTLPEIGTVVGAMLLITAGTMVVLLPFFALFSYIVARQATRRIDTLAAATSALRQGQYATRVAVAGQDEIARLQADFNAMAGELERSLRELHAERDRAARLMQAQRQLVASVSHELRTPVATMRGYLDAALDPAGAAAASPAALQADLAVLQREAGRLQALIDDLFALARAEAHSLSLQCAPTDIGQLTLRIVETVAPLAWQRSRIAVVAEIAPDLPLALIDAARWEQILHNLLHNAVRHTSPGGIVAVAARPDGRQLAVEVRDTGGGIAPEDLPHIFERFYRGAGASPADGGTGLGLALVKELLEAMGGSVEVSSAVGMGSCFTLRVPSAAQAAHQARS